MSRVEWWARFWLGGWFVDGWQWLADDDQWETWMSDNHARREQ